MEETTKKKPGVMVFSGRPCPKPPFTRNARLKFIKELDALFSQVIKNKAGGVCEMCGGRGTQASHIISKKAGGFGLRWDTDNAVWLCFYCHFHRWHGDPIYAVSWIKEKMGDRYEKLISKKREVVRFTKSFYEIKKQELKEVIDDKNS